MSPSHPSHDWKPLDASELSALLPDTYEVTDLLGRGGMGAVYLARQVNLDRLVAIKVLPLQDAAQADDAMHFAERFVQEARTMARISHNGIVAVYDFGRVKVKPANSELLYFVMEYMDGTDVLGLIREQGKLKPDDALSITAHVCDALSFAHEKGMIHRDIKPANVMINADGFVKVADFGLARPVSMATSAGLTQSGFAVGTPDFMAPEMLIAPTSTRSA
jgi:serine/threonine protein kinase